MQSVIIRLRDLDIIVKMRAVIIINGNVATKTYADPADAEYELGWYQRVPWACPTLIDHGPRHLVIAAYPTAADLPDYQPVEELHNLLLRLESDGYSHRDIHPGNIVKTPDGPRLIDWECAIDQPGYDLHGPDSGVPIPDIHKALEPMWWGADHESSIATLWT